MNHLRQNRPLPIMALLALLPLTVAAHANGAWSEFPAGGVVFKKVPEISILREDLEIGLDEIRVRYVFNSFSREPLERTIGFPMAKVPLDDSPDNFEDRSRARDGEDARNYMAFKVSVDGKPIAATLHEYAWSGEDNVTARLADLGVPVFAPDIEAFEKLARLPEATIRALAQEDLATQDGSWVIPKWQYQSVYEWTQSFEAGHTIVEVSYKPLFGSDYGPEPYFESGSKSADYCYDNATRQMLAGLSGFPEPFTVGYVLKTAANWNGPIGRFNLRINNEEGGFARFCVPEGLKAVGDGASWFAEEFVPSSDLAIVFFLPHDRP